MRPTAMPARGFTVWSLWQGRAVVLPYAVHCGHGDTSREKARDFAARMNRVFGREGNGTGRYLAGPVDRPPPVEAFE